MSLKRLETFFNGLLSSLSCHKCCNEAAQNIVLQLLSQGFLHIACKLILPSFISLYFEADFTGLSVRSGQSPCVKYIYVAVSYTAC